MNARTIVGIIAVVAALGLTGCGKSEAEKVVAAQQELATAQANLLNEPATKGDVQALRDLVNQMVGANAAMAADLQQVKTDVSTQAEFTTSLRQALNLAGPEAVSALTAGGQPISYVSTEDIAGLGPRDTFTIDGKTVICFEVGVPRPADGTLCRLVGNRYVCGNGDGQIVGPKPSTPTLTPAPGGGNATNTPVIVTLTPPPGGGATSTAYVVTATSVTLPTLTVTPPAGSMPNGKVVVNDGEVVVIYDGRTFVLPTPVYNFFILLESPPAQAPVWVVNWINVNNINDVIWFQMWMEACRKAGVCPTLPVETPEPVNTAYPPPFTATPPVIIIDPDPDPSPTAKPPTGDWTKIACGLQVLDLGVLPRWVVDVAEWDVWFHPIFDLTAYNGSGGNHGQWSWANSVCIKNGTGGKYMNFFRNDGRFIFRMDQTDANVEFAILTASQHKAQFMQGGNYPFSVNVRTMPGTVIEAWQNATFKGSREVSPGGDLTVILPDDGARFLKFDVHDPNATHEVNVWVGPYDRSVNINTLDAR